MTGGREGRSSVGAVIAILVLTLLLAAGITVGLARLGVRHGALLTAGAVLLGAWGTLLGLTALLRRRKTPHAIGLATLGALLGALALALSGAGVFGARLKTSEAAQSLEPIIREYSVFIGFREARLGPLVGLAAAVLPLAFGILVLLGALHVRRSDWRDGRPPGAARAALATVIALAVLGGAVAVAGWIQPVASMDRAVRPHLVQIGSDHAAGAKARAWAVCNRLGYVLDDLAEETVASYLPAYREIARTCVERLISGALPAECAADALGRQLRLGKASGREAEVRKFCAR